MTEIYGYIYKIENLVNGKVYIGLTTQKPSRRKNEHLRILKQNKHNNPHLQRAFNKYGKCNFKFTVLNYATSKEVLNQLEIDYISNYDCLDRNKGYNIKTGGFNGRISPETKIKLSENACCYWKGKHLSKKTREKLRKANIGKKLSLETRKKISKANKGRFKGEKHPFYGKKLPKETCKKIGKIHRNKGLFGFTGTTPLKNKNPERKCWRSSIKYNAKSLFLGLYEDPLSAQIIHDFLFNEIHR